MALEIYIHGQQAGSSNLGTFADPINDYNTLRNQIIAYNGDNLTITMKSGGRWRGRLPPEHLNYQNVTVRGDPNVSQLGMLDGGERRTNWTETASGVTGKKLWLSAGLPNSVSGNTVSEASNLTVDDQSVASVHWRGSQEATVLAMSAFDYSHSWNYADGTMLLLAPSAFNPNIALVEVSVWRSCIDNLASSVVANAYVVRDLIFKRYGYPIRVHKAPGCILQRLSGYSIGGGYRHDISKWDGSFVEINGGCSGAVIEDIYGEAVEESAVSVRIANAAGTQDSVTVRRILGNHVGTSCVDFTHQDHSGAFSDLLRIEDVTGYRIRNYSAGNLRPDSANGNGAVVSHSQVLNGAANGTSRFTNTTLKRIKSNDSRLIALNIRGLDAVTYTIEQCAAIYPTVKIFPAFSIFRDITANGITAVNFQANVVRNAATGIDTALNTQTIQLSCNYNAMDTCAVGFSGTSASNVALRLQNNVFQAVTNVVIGMTANGKTTTSLGGNYVTATSAANFTSVAGDATGQSALTYEANSYLKPINNSTVYQSGVVLAGTYVDQLGFTYPTSGTPIPRGAYSKYNTSNSNVIGATPAPTRRKVLLLGDESTMGSAPSGGTNENTYVSYRGYLGVLLQQANLSVDFVGPNQNGCRNGFSDIDHAAYAAATIGAGDNSGNNLFDRIETLIDNHAPDVVILMCGANNLAGVGAGTTGISAAYTALLNKIAFEAPNAKIIAAAIPQPTWLNPTQETAWNDMLAAQVAWAATPNDLRYSANIHTAANLVDPTDYQDGTNYTVTGATKVATALLAAYQAAFTLEVAAPQDLTRQNLVLGSTNFAATAWQLRGNTLVANTLTPPQGVPVVHTLTNGTSTAGENLTQVIPGFVAGQPGTLAVRAKKGTHNWMAVKFSSDNYTQSTWVFFDLENGALGRVFEVNSSGGSAFIVPQEQGFFLCAITNSLTATRIVEIYACAANETYGLLQGHSINIAGVQAERGTKATWFKNTSNTAVTTRTLSSLAVTLPLSTLGVSAATTATLTLLDQTGAPWDQFGPVTAFSSDPTKAIIADPTVETDGYGRIQVQVTGVGLGTTQLTVSSSGYTSSAVPLQIVAAATLAIPLIPVVKVINSDTVDITVGGVVAEATNVVVMATEVTLNLIGTYLGSPVYEEVPGTYTPVADVLKGNTPIRVNGLKPATRYRFWAYVYNATGTSAGSVGTVDATTMSLYAETFVSPSAVGVTDVDVQLWRQATNGAIVGESIGLFEDNVFGTVAVTAEGGSRARMQITIPAQPPVKLRNGNLVNAYLVKPGSPKIKTKIIDNATIVEAYLGAVPVITSNGGGDTANISIAENQSAVTTVLAVG